MADAGYPSQRPENQPGREDDAELVARAQAGDRSAFDALVRAHQARVFALGYRWFRNSDDADDLVQETFVRVWRSLERFDRARPFVPWLMTIATNRAKTFHERRRPAEELDEGLTWSGPSPEDDAAAAERNERLQRAAQDLPEEQRVVLHLRVVEQLRAARPECRVVHS